MSKDEGKESERHERREAKREAKKLAKERKLNAKFERDMRRRDGAPDPGVEFMKHRKASRPQDRVKRK